MRLESVHKAFGFVIGLMTAVGFTTDAAEALAATFNKEIAPILFTHCAGCHHPGGAGPFSLMTVEEARKHAKEIVEVTGRRLMPPWLPSDSPGTFRGERLLKASEIQALKAWAESGMSEGLAGDLPSKPVFSSDWQLGPPDLVLEMPEAYTLAPEGQDVYRFFVVPVSVTERKFVRAVEFKPDNSKVVHHAVVLVDRTGYARLQDEREPGPGFGGGMLASRAQVPDGIFIGWTPGKRVNPGADGLAWNLWPGSDMVLQLHLRPTGKPEKIKAAVGIYFASKPPVQKPYALVVRNKQIEIPAGATNHPLSAEVELPLEVELRRIAPHAHFLGKQMDCSATLPDGRTLKLLTIPQWDFGWQDEYELMKPITLPKGTKVGFHYGFDNSDANPRNPNHPPKRVVFGQNSSDEMGELMLQVIPRSSEDFDRLRSHFARLEVLKDIESTELRLKQNPSDAATHVYVGKRYRQVGNAAKAMEHFQKAVEVEPRLASAQLALGQEFERTRRADEALDCYEKASSLAPADPEAADALARLLLVHPEETKRDAKRALGLARVAVENSKGRDPDMLETLVIACASNGLVDEAVAASGRAIKAAEAMGLPTQAAAIKGRLERYKKSEGR